MLLNRMSLERHATKYDPAHAEQWMSRIAGSPAFAFVPDRDDAHVYADTRWLAFVSQSDQYRDMGGYDIAEKGYLDIISMLRKVQAPATSDIAWMFDHLGEFYLDTRNFDKAYDFFSQAVAVRRQNIAALTPAQDGAITDAMRQQSRTVVYALGGVQADPAVARKVCRLHLAELLTQLGRLDLSKGDLTRAGERLAEAVVISNENGYKQFVSGLNAIYFQSAIFEKQGRWADAEALWKNATSLRETMSSSRAYWDSMQEMAAFYARHGELHTAAEIARRAQAGLADKRIRPAFPMPYPIHSRPWMEMDPSIDAYTALSSTAMSEIVALDTWTTQSAEAASALLKDPIDLNLHGLLSAGSDSQRAQNLTWWQRVSDLRMSMLLDGNPSDERIAKAYDLLGQIKGRYLASIGELNRMVQLARGNPNISTADLATMDQLAAMRAHHAALFVDTALNGKPYAAQEFSRTDNAERVLTTALSNGPYPVAYTRFSSAELPARVPADALFVDYVGWDRSERGSLNKVREYGVFVSQAGLGVKFVRLGAAKPIDDDIDALNKLAIDGRMRGLKRIEETPAVAQERVKPLLQSLYAKLMLPLQDIITRKTRLFVVPDGKISFAPLGALLSPDGHFLLEHHRITYLSSWRDLHGAEKVTSTPPVIVANPDFNLIIGAPSKADPNHPVFEPLPGTQAEADATANSWNLRSQRVLTGGAARKWLIQSLRGPALLHMATHSEPYLQWQAPRSDTGMFEHPQPLATTDPFLQSIIALAGAGRPQSSEDNGLLTGLEIASLDLQGTLLVVLSSCESAQGTPIDGQGVLGLRAAFAVAGAQSLVMSLWPVDDQAGAVYMGFFYSHISQGPAEAVRLAQIDMLTDPKYQNPFYWAGYLSSGDAPPIDVQAINRAASADDNVLATPLCLEISAHEVQGSHYLLRDVLRLKVGGAITRLKQTATTVEYELDGPIDDLTEIESSEVNGVTVQPIEVKHANAMRLNMQLILEKQPDHSTFSIRVGSPRFPLEQHRLISLRGAANLFNLSSLPQTFPPRGSFTQVTDSFHKNAVFDRVGACASGATFAAM